MSLNYSDIQNPEKSRFVERISRRYSDYFSMVPLGRLSRSDISIFIDELQAKKLDLSAALRVARQLLLHRIIQQDCRGEVSLEEVMETLTLMAEEAIERAHTAALEKLQSLHGEPLTEIGAPANMAIIAMGKFGSRELNASSDIDLVYIYDFTGETSGDKNGRGCISNQEFFTKVVRIIYGLIGEVTEHGFVFRVDTALRPNGNSGPIVVSLAVLDEYFLTQGREWERFAWLKSRIVAPIGSVNNDLAQRLRRLVMPFVFRNYLDYNVFESLRQLHGQIRDHANKRSASRPYRNNDVKLSRGGIREIEFIVQLVQIVRGGQYPELRTRPTINALGRLVKAGLMIQDIAEKLERSYIFLRCIEHFIQYLDDHQTHILPINESDLQWVALGVGYKDTASFLESLEAHRSFVESEFESLLGASITTTTNIDTNVSIEDGGRLTGLLSQLSGAFHERVAKWQTSQRFQDLREMAQIRVVNLLYRANEILKNKACNEQSVIRFLDWFEPLLRRENYAAQLCEQPKTFERLLRMLGTAKWPARYLSMHPGVIDELGNGRLLDKRFDAHTFEESLQNRMYALAENGEADDESLLNFLRRAHHAEVFRTLARDVEGKISVEQVADDLSYLAMAVLRVTTNWCWQRLKNKHREIPQFGIIAYGKLGGLELGYGSDLDIVFIYDDDDESSGEMYTHLVRKLIHWITIKTGEGDIYEIDTTLRPNGGAGLLVITIDAYEKYQHQRGSNTAWTWEHQAMTRARCVYGSSALEARFNEIRQSVISIPRDVSALRCEIIAMRDRIHACYTVQGDLFDVKHSVGGMVDIEFAVQFLVLAYGCKYPILLKNSGNIALIMAAGACGLLDKDVANNASTAYRQLRHIQHQARLNEENLLVKKDQIEQEIQASMCLLTAVFHTDHT
jgi:[glutamine synthetase] adenylyltransferase / [glutamine synthetase]-adenylyl-L-tyrosine phosphorylase